ncbi:hypothetical protein GGX14DRAFT_407602 [Mycena pura]|uniref:Uncharacterized protein n=1 Tax=Mycena pura TaxID=153505 RepID=A0AAD6UN37_9AGAR|nr:hypothetical protein GGX14DRAFT_407602 [Mycena pura]
MCGTFTKGNTLANSASSVRKSGEHAADQSEYEGTRSETLGGDRNMLHSVAGGPVAGACSPTDHARSSRRPRIGRASGGGNVVGDSDFLSRGHLPPPGLALPLSQLRSLWIWREQWPGCPLSWVAIQKARLGSSVARLIDVTFTVKNAFVRGKRSRVFDCVSIMRPHEHMGGLQGEMKYVGGGQERRWKLKKRRGSLKDSDDSGDDPACGKRVVCLRSKPITRIYKGLRSENRPEGIPRFRVNDAHFVPKYSERSNTLSLRIEEAIVNMVLVAEIGEHSTFRGARSQRKKGESDWWHG